MLKLTAAAALSLMLALDASASVITFNGLAGTAQPNGNVYPGSTNNKPYTSFGSGVKAVVDGFAFTAGTYQTEYLFSSEYYKVANNPTSYAGNGTDFLMGRDITMTSATGALFTLNQVDLTWLTLTSPSTATLVGTKADGTLVSKSLSITANNIATANDFTTFTFTQFTDLKSLRFTAPSDYLAIDNMTVNASAVPEPTTLALMGLGLAGLVARRRRK